MVIFAGIVGAILWILNMAALTLALNMEPLEPRRTGLKSMSLIIFWLIGNLIWISVSLQILIF